MKVSMQNSRSRKVTTFLGVDELSMLMQHLRKIFHMSIVPKGEFHGATQPASGALLTGVVSTGEIHLKTQYASQVPVAGVAL